GGGGICSFAPLALQGSTLSGNAASGDGGGLLIEGAVSLQNSTLSGNAATDAGGGILTTGALTGQHSTITQSHSDSNNDNSGTRFGAFGGGIFVAPGNSATLHNTIVAGNFRGSGTATESDIDGTVLASSTNNLIGTGGSGGLANGTNGNKV